jgi:hypothetical protein
MDDPEILWIKKNQPDIYNRAAMIGEYQDTSTCGSPGNGGSIGNSAIRWHTRRSTAVSAQPVADARSCRSRGEMAAGHARRDGHRAADARRRSTSD